MTIRPIRPIRPIVRNVKPMVSYSSDYSTDSSIQKIDTPASNKLLFDLSSEESYQESISSEQNWKPNINSQALIKQNKNIDHSRVNESSEKLSVTTSTQPKKIQRNSSVGQSTNSKSFNSLDNSAQKINKYDLDNNYYSYYDYESNNSDHTHLHKIRPNQNSPNKSKGNFDNQHSHNENEPRNAQSEIHPKSDQNFQLDKQQVPPPTSNDSQYVNQMSTPNNQENKTYISNNLNMSQLEPNSSDENEQKFTISYKQKNLQALWKRQVIMTQNDFLVYICNSTKKDDYGKVHIIYDQKPAGVPSQSGVGMLVRHQTGLRFTLYEKVADYGTIPQIAGISFFNPKEDFKIRSFRIALPTDDRPYIPESKKEDLSRIAKKNENVPPNVKVYQSMMPIKKPDGTFTLNLGQIILVRSTKNFCIKDENDQSLFLIYKTSEQALTVKFKPPFTALIAYSIAVAICTSTK